MFYVFVRTPLPQKQEIATIKMLLSTVDLSCKSSNDSISTDRGAIMIQDPTTLAAVLEACGKVVRNFILLYPQKIL